MLISLLLLYSRLVPTLFAYTFKKYQWLRFTVLRQGAEEQKISLLSRLKDLNLDKINTKYKHKSFFQNVI